jgi:hypothetical protein
LAGEVEIYIDGEKRGAVGPEGSPLGIEDIKPGQRTVKLMRKGTNANTYITFERLLQFYEDIDTVIAYELGPKEDFSEGHVITAYKSYVNDSQTKLNVTTKPTEVKVSLDGQDIGRSPLNGIQLDISKVHKLKFEKQGYEDVEINLLPEDAKARDKLKGYDINVEVNLFLIPIRVNG